MARRRGKEDARSLLARGQGLVDVDNAEADRVLREALAAATTRTLEGACQDALGILRRRTSDNDAAMTLFRASIESCRADDDHAGEARALVHLAGVEIDTGLPEDAIAHLREGLAAAKKRRDPALEAHVADVLSFALEAAGEHEEAEALARHGLELLAGSSDERQLAISLGNQAVQHQLAGRMKEAERGYRRALELSERVGDLHNAATVSCNLGTLWVAQGRFLEAAPFIERGMSLHEKIGNRAGAAHAALSMADLRSSEGDSLAAIELQRRAIAQFHAAGNRYLEGVALGNMGNEEMTIGRLELALRHHGEAIELLRMVRQEKSEACVLTNQALALAEAGRTGEGLAGAERAREIFRKLRDGRWEGIALLSIGLIEHLSSPNAAAASYRRALELLEEAKDPSQIARALICLAAIDLRTGEKGRADELLDRAKAEGETSGDREVGLLVESMRRGTDPPRGITGRLLWRVTYPT
jgi:tetratricopeptide (TPR) repeat protein